MDARRVRVRRVPQEEKLIVRKSAPKWQEMDIVRIKIDGNGSDLEASSSYVPDIFTVLAVRPDPMAIEHAKNTAVEDPGAEHRYTLRSYLNGRTFVLTQSCLQDIDAKFRRYALAFFKGHFIKVREALEDKLGIVEDIKEDDPIFYEPDDHEDDIGEEDCDDTEDEEEAQVSRWRRRQIVEEEDDEYSDLDNRPQRRSWRGD